MPIADMGVCPPCRPLLDPTPEPPSGAWPWESYSAVTEPPSFTTSRILYSITYICCIPGHPICAVQHDTPVFMLEFSGQPMACVWYVLQCLERSVNALQVKPER